jgi:hypothetical protein
MFNPLDYPVLVLVVSLSTFWLSASIGRWLSKKTRNLSEDGHDDFQFVLGGTLTFVGSDHRLYLFDGCQPLRSAQEL